MRLDGVDTKTLERMRTLSGSTVTTGMHMLLGREGMTPAGLILARRQELARFPAVSILSAKATKVLVEDSEGGVSTTAGRKISTDRLVLAMGVVDQLPSIPGVDTAYGKCLFPCPLRDGFEVSGHPSSKDSDAK